ncbi:hypothetical protein BLNAU_7522 [Blattamonas nauphoetae]|uniref:Uncharacterized protein n=1 Tax=Blattamonas nauphoetae TaxID=2049346 RepID=A0ABQ9Y1N6_9EUKA|nr:hypothetical protein BLNAU_7522 [Blattamonas nauphoetae]
MRLLNNLFFTCTPTIRLALVTADLISLLIPSLNPQSLCFAETADIHTCLIQIIAQSLLLATPFGLKHLGFEDDNKHQAVHETVLQQVLIPSEMFIGHLCMNRFSNVDGNQSWNFMELLAQLLRISPSYQPTMELVLHMPVILTIPSCLTFYENDRSISYFLSLLFYACKEWNERMGTNRQMWKTVSRMMRIEGIEDVIEEKLRNDKNEDIGRWIVAYSIEWSNLQGMNIPEQD